MSKSVRSRGEASEPARIEPKPDKRGPKPIPGPGGRRGFYARPFAMSTTFSRKTRIFHRLEKSPENQLILRLIKRSARLRERLMAATLLTYRFALEASSTLVGRGIAAPGAFGPCI